MSTVRISGTSRSSLGSFKSQKLRASSRYRAVGNSFGSCFFFPNPRKSRWEFARSWLFVDDASAGLQAVAERGRIGEIYNLGTYFEKNGARFYFILKIMKKFKYTIWQYASKLKSTDNSEDRSVRLDSNRFPTDPTMIWDTWSGLRKQTWNWGGSRTYLLRKVEIQIYNSGCSIPEFTKLPEPLGPFYRQQFGTSQRKGGSYKKDSGNFVDSGPG